MEALNAALWTYDERSFLPHGSARDGSPEEQPIWLTTACENPNGAKVLILADGARPETGERLDDWSLVLEIFDGGDEVALSAARERWSAYKVLGHTLAYWQQSDEGKWRKA